jgi:hypothetical protein
MQIVTLNSSADTEKAQDVGRALGLEPLHKPHDAFYPFAAE